MKKTIFDLDAVETQDTYKLLSGIVVPRPIGWIGTRRDNGTYNLAPFSFFNVVAVSPPTVLFSGAVTLIDQKTQSRSRRERGSSRSTSSVSPWPQR